MSVHRTWPLIAHPLIATIEYEQDTYRATRSSIAYREPVLDAYKGGELVAEVIRSGFVESRHLGSVAVLDAAGNTVAAIGDITAPIFPRSALKPLQAFGMLRAGLPPASAADLALICASHRGEPIHTDRVRAMLASAGLDQDALRNPPARPLGDASGEPTKVNHNCSGKHAGMLLTCLHNGWPLDSYEKPDHPLQQQVKATIEDLAREESAATGVDGCGAPVLALSLTALARAFVAITLSEVADAMRAHPELVSGTDDHAHDTILMRENPGMISKGGAEGVHVVGIPNVGAVAIKIDDGAKRALMPVLHGGLRRLGLDVPTPPEPVEGGGREVGAVRAVV
jgi:L-asparaginase II